MPLFRCSVWLLGALLSFTSVVHSDGPNPTDDFCSLSYQMSRTPFDLSEWFFRLFTDQGLKHIVAQKDDMLYIAGGWMLYPSPYTNYNGPSSCPF